MEKRGDFWQGNSNNCN